MHGAGRLSAERAGGDRWPWVALGVAMAVASAVILSAGEGLTFSVDELSYFGRVVYSEGDPLVYAFGLEYLLAPHNGHLQLGGKLVYEASFGLFGASHAPLRVAELVGVLACVALFFELARRRVGPAPALAASILLLFMGAAWEVMLWAFDLHTTFALAFGLAAILALEREGRGAELAACGLLAASLTMIEVGLTFLVAAAVIITHGRATLRRAWIVVVPGGLYAAWWVWAQRFGHEDVDLARFGDLPSSVAESMVAVTAALTGLYAHGAGVAPFQIDPEPAAAAVAALATIALVVGLWRVRVTPRGWGLVAALAVYWVFIALADRPPDSSRYMWYGAIVLLLVAAEVLAGWAARPRGGFALAAAVAAVFALALPVGLDKLSDGRDWLRSASDMTRVELAMLDLGGRLADPELNPTVRLYLSPGIPNEAYLRAANRIGSPGFPIDELNELPAPLRSRADQVLARAYELAAEPAGRGTTFSGCRTAGSKPLPLPPGGAAFRAPATGGELALGRFADAGVVELEPLAANAEVVVEIPDDAARDPWRAYVSPGTRVCDL